MHVTRLPAVSCCCPLQAPAVSRLPSDAAARAASSGMYLQSAGSCVVLAPTFTGGCGSLCCSAALRGAGRAGRGGGRPQTNNRQLLAFVCMFVPPPQVPAVRHRTGRYRGGCAGAGRPCCWILRGQLPGARPALLGEQVLLGLPGPVGVLRGGAPLGGCRDFCSNCQSGVGPTTTKDTWGFLGGSRGKLEPGSCHSYDLVVGLLNVWTDASSSSPGAGQSPSADPLASGNPSKRMRLPLHASPTTARTRRGR